MLKLNQKGAIQFAVLLILLAGIVGIVYLVTQGPLKIFPKAGGGLPPVPETSFTLSTQNKSASVGDLIAVKLEVRTDIAAANLFDAKMKFDNSILEVNKIDITNKTLDPSFTTFITSWVEEFSDNSTGEVSLVGGVSNPGYQTISTDPSSLMATIYFKAVKEGNTTISFTDSSAIYSNANSTNILTGKNNVVLSVSNVGTSIPVACPTPPACSGQLIVGDPSDPNQCPVYKCITPTPPPSTVVYSFDEFLSTFGKAKTDSGFNPKYDYNNDGIITIVDFSGLRGKFDLSTIVFTPPLNLTDFMSTFGKTSKDSGFNVKYDVNNDGIVNIIDFSLLKTAKPTPISTPKPGTGDGNGDGRINLVDMSVLLSSFPPARINKEVDLNGDGVINSFDFSLMRNLLIQNKVIKGT